MHVGELRKALANLLGGQDFVLDAVGLRQPDGAQGEVALICRIELGARRQHQKPGLLEQRLARQRLKLTPDAMRIAHDRHILRALANRKPCDSGIAMTGAEVMRRVMTINSDDVHPRFRQLVNRGGAHRAQA